MTKLQELFIRNLRNERKRLRLTQEQAAEKIGITHSFYAAVEGGAKFPSVQKIQDIGEAFGVPAYRLFIDQPEIEEMPSSELLDRFADFLIEQYRKDVVEAKTKFLKGLETQKETGKNPFEGDEMFRE
ncbi:MAG: helix-turn-helix transcriptional regulator [Spirochaetia bacterium]|jgi:transcriptional regulator with XRE-family HTH domain